MPYGGGMPPQPGPGFGGQGYGQNPMGAAKGGGPMPMGPGGGGGMPMGGMKGGQGPMPMQGGPPPRQPGGQMTPGGGGMPDPSQMQWRGYQQPQGFNQESVDGAMMDLQRAQIMGADPMVIARLEQTAMQAQRSLDQAQMEQYATQMGQMSQRGPGPIGGGRGQSQLEQNPYLQMLLQSQLGMGGGGSNAGMRSSGNLGSY